MIWIAAGLYALYGAWLAWRLPWTDGEYTLLPAGAALHRAHNERDEFGESVRGQDVGGVTRLTFRMPGSYWLYAWARWIPLAWQRPLGRLQSLAVSTAGAALGCQWAEELGGPRAAWLVLAVLLSTAALTGAYASASYEGATAALWLGGLYALAHGTPIWASSAGSGVLALRVLAWPQAVVLWAFSGMWGIAAAVLTGLVLVWPRRSLFMAGRQAVRRVSPRADTTWRYAIRTFAQRFEVWIGWGILSIWAGWPDHMSALLVASSLTVWLVGHGLVGMVRPKWLVGYFPDVALPIVVALAVHLSSLPVGWPSVGIGLCVGWGLARPRHSAITGPWGRA